MSIKLTDLAKLEDILEKNLNDIEDCLHKAKEELFNLTIPKEETEEADLYIDDVLGLMHVLKMNIEDLLRTAIEHEKNTVVLIKSRH